MLVYVDDIILTGNNQHAIDDMVHRISQTFVVQDLGDLSYFLGLDVTPHNFDLVLSQRKYIHELLQRPGLAAAKPFPTPMTTNVTLTLGDSPAFSNPTKYRKIVGALQYVTLSRPDIAFVVNKVCQFMHSPTSNHWSAVKRILRYLHGTDTYGLRFTHDSPTILHAYTDSAYNSLTGFSDADWAAVRMTVDPRGDMQYILALILFPGPHENKRLSLGRPLSRNTKRWLIPSQKSHGFEHFLQELCIPIKYAPTLWCDNLGATYLSANLVFHARTKHREIDFHLVREKAARRQLQV